MKRIVIAILLLVACREKTPESVAPVPEQKAGAEQAPTAEQAPAPAPASVSAELTRAEAFPLLKKTEGFPRQITTEISLKAAPTCNPDEPSPFEGLIKVNVDTSQTFYDAQCYQNQSKGYRYALAPTDEAQPFIVARTADSLTVKHV